MSDFSFDPWMLEHLVCPRHRCTLRREGDELICPTGHAFPIVDEIPIMVLDDVKQTHWVASELIEMVKKYRGGELIGIEQATTATGIDPQVQGLVAYTCGNLYGPLVGKLERYPIPELRLPTASGQTFLDIGCGWGRWSIAASRKGYAAVCLDPSLRHVLAARRVARQLGAPCRFVVGDARFLPFAPGIFDVAFSYSVLQHFSKADVRQVLASIAQVIKPAGTCIIQMPNGCGVRSLYHQVKRGFREAQTFDVRYWTPQELVSTFTDAIGETSISVDGFFGLGIQPNDIDMLPRHFQLVVRCSEALRRMANRAPWLGNLADSLYVTSRRRVDGAHQAA